MSELQQALQFLRRGKRRRIVLDEYIQLQMKYRKWSKQKELRLLQQVQKSNILSIDYEPGEIGVRRLLVIKTGVCRSTPEKTDLNL